MATITKEKITILDDTLEVDVKEITVSEVYDALAKNGFTHLRSTWFGENIYDYKEKQFSPTKGCVLAQAAFNLGVAAVTDVINYWFKNKYSSPSYLMRLPLTGYNLYEQLNRFEMDEHNPWFVPANDNNDQHLIIAVGETIIHWNDKEKYSEDDSGYTEYELETYEDVTKMAYDVLEPHFDKTIKVLVASRESGIPLAAPPRA